MIATWCNCCSACVRKLVYLVCSFFHKFVFEHVRVWTEQFERCIVAEANAAAYQARAQTNHTNKSGIAISSPPPPQTFWNALVAAFGTRPMAAHLPNFCSVKLRWHIFKLSWMRGLLLAGVKYTVHYGILQHSTVMPILRSCFDNRAHATVHPGVLFPAHTPNILMQRHVAIGKTDKAKLE